MSTGERSRGGKCPPWEDLTSLPDQSCFHLCCFESLRMSSLSCFLSGLFSHWFPHTKLTLDTFPHCLSSICSFHCLLIAAYSRTLVTFLSAALTSPCFNSPTGSCTTLWFLCYFTVYNYIYLCLSVSIHLLVRLFVCLCYLCLFIHLSICIYQSTSLSSYMFMYMYVCMYVIPPSSRSIVYLSVSVSVIYHCVCRREGRAKGVVEEKDKGGGRAEDEMFARGLCHALELMTYIYLSLHLPI